MSKIISNDNLNYLNYLNNLNKNIPEPNKPINYELLYDKYLKIKNDITQYQYNLSNNQFDNIYLYDLKIITKNGEKRFSYTESKKYVNLIQLNDKLYYNDLEEYELIVNYKDTYYSLFGKINNNLSYNTNNNNNLFIEFSHDNSGYTICTCYFLNKDINILCISPPN